MEIDFGQVAGPRKGNDQSDELEAWKASFSGRKAPGNSNLWHGQPSRVSSLSTRSNRSNALRWAKFSKTRGNKIQCCLFFFSVPRTREF